MSKAIFSKKYPQASIRKIDGRWFDNKPVVGWWCDHEFLGDVRVVFLNITAENAMQQFEKWLAERGFKS